MLPCPACRAPLRIDNGHRGMCWTCNACGGELFTITALKAADPRIAGDLQRAARGPREAETRICPLCADPLARIHAGGPPPLPLDVCDHCRAIWFDHREYEAVIPPPPGRPTGAPPPMREAPTHWPWFTYVLMLACATVSIWAWSTGRSAFSDWGYLASDPWRHYGLTILTCFFLHANPAHLIGNLLVLWSFGEVVEETLGRSWFLLMLALATIAGCAMHGLIDHHPDIPCVGASGGIAGLLSYFCTRFPHRKIYLYISVGWTWTNIPMSAITWLVIWLLSQIGGAVWEYYLGSSIAYGAHLGGALTGVTFLLARHWLSPPTVADLKKPWWIR